MAGDVLFVAVVVFGDERNQLGVLDTYMLWFGCSYKQPDALPAYMSAAGIPP